MLIGAHPDDIEYFASGLVASLKDPALELNVSTRNLVVTSGNAGGSCYNMSTRQPHPPGHSCEREELAFIRRQEMIAAGAVLGTDVVWRGGFDDGEAAAAATAASDNDADTADADAAADAMQIAIATLMLMSRHAHIVPRVDGAGAHRGLHPRLQAARHRDALSVPELRGAADLQRRVPAGT